MQLADNIPLVVTGHAVPEEVLQRIATRVWDLYGRWPLATCLIKQIEVQNYEDSIPSLGRFYYGQKMILNWTRLEKKPHRLEEVIDHEWAHALHRQIPHKHECYAAMADALGANGLCTVAYYITRRTNATLNNSEAVSELFSFYGRYPDYLNLYKAIAAFGRHTLEGGTADECNAGNWRSHGHRRWPDHQQDA